MVSSKLGSRRSNAGTPKICITPPPIPPTPPLWPPGKPITLDCYYYSNHEDPYWNEGSDTFPLTRQTEPGHYRGNGATPSTTADVDVQMSSDWTLATTTLDLYETPLGHHHQAIESQAQANPDTPAGHALLQTNYPDYGEAYAEWHTPPP